MQLSWHILEACTHCRYKAWRIFREENVPDVRLDGNQITVPGNRITLKNKIVSVAFYLSRTHSHREKSVQVRCDSQTTQVGVSTYAAKASALLTDCNETLAAESPPQFYRNRHCVKCAYWSGCRKALEERDCISLLGGMTGQVLMNYHRKGLFTIRQLSYTFKPRKRGHRMGQAYIQLWPLRALALRERRVYVLERPDMPQAPVYIYTDFESLPDKDFVYLIGAVVSGNGNTSEHSFWADVPTGEESVFEAFLSCVEHHTDSIIFHYGSYERRMLGKAAKRYGFMERATPVLNRMIDLQVYFRTHVYPPVYANGLKELGSFLGITWSDNANGEISIVWRKSWESTGNDSWKGRLVRYNTEDCMALVKVHQWLTTIAEGACENTTAVTEMRTESNRFRDNSVFSEDFRIINEAAYFDYQRHKIHLGERPGKTKKPKKMWRATESMQSRQADEVVEIPKNGCCTKCGSTRLYRMAAKVSCRQTTLKMTANGMCRWVVEYRSGQWRCAECKRKRNDANVLTLQYGDNFFAWAANMYVVHNVGYAGIAEIAREQFGISVIPTYLMLHKRKWLKKWEPELALIKEAVLKSPVIHIDETSIRLRNAKGHVWTLATPHAVYYTYTPTREAGWLEAVLGEYEGVVVTDFFTGFDALPVKRQKCLIHLIRDMNDDLFRNPFDTEFSLMVKAFGELLRKIVSGVDRYGLVADRLAPYLNNVGGYYRTYIEPGPASQMALKYTKRLSKHWDEMWTFLECDGVPWNNNYAENAIKPFARFRHRADGLINETGMTEYLHLLSMAQTCKYRGIPFLEFLLRGNGDAL